MTFKSIAVPPRSASNRRDDRTGSDLPVTQSARLVRATAGHRFSLGDRLNMAPGGREVARSSSICVVTALLPFEGTTLRYRVRSEAEKFDRIIDENDLTALGPDLE